MQDEIRARLEDNYSAIYVRLVSVMQGLVLDDITLSKSNVQSPDRPETTVPGKGFSLAMPAWTPGLNIAVLPCR